MKNSIWLSSMLLMTLFEKMLRHNSFTFLRWDLKKKKKKSDHFRRHRLQTSIFSKLHHSKKLIRERKRHRFYSGYPLQLFLKRQENKWISIQHYAALTNGSHSSRDDILSNSINITYHGNFEWTNNNLILQELSSTKTELRSKQG